MLHMQIIPTTTKVSAPLARGNAEAFTQFPDCSPREQIKLQRCFAVCLKCTGTVLEFL